MFSHFTVDKGMIGTRNLKDIDYVSSQVILIDYDFKEVVNVNIVLRFYLIWLRSKNSENVFFDNNRFICLPIPPLCELDFHPTQIIISGVKNKFEYFPKIYLDEYSQSCINKEREYFGIIQIIRLPLIAPTLQHFTNNNNNNNNKTIVSLDGVIHNVCNITMVLCKKITLTTTTTQVIIHHVYQVNFTENQ